MLELVGRCRDGQGRKCDRDGVMRLAGQDGAVVPGVSMCREHAEECLREYAAKLGEVWTMIDVQTGQRTAADALPAVPREYNTDTDYHMIRKAVQEAGPAGGMLAAVKRELEANGIKWPASFNANNGVSAKAIDRDIQRAFTAHLSRPG
jgi:hypothetical protein